MLGFMSWTVRRARPGDAEEIARINVEGWRASYRGIVSGAALAELDVQRVAEEYRGVIDMPDPVAVFLAVCGKRIAAFCGVCPARDASATPTPRRTGKIAALYADPPLLGTGAGHAAHGEGVRHLAAAGFEHAVLWGMQDNAPARRFYEHHGWTCDSVHGRHTLACTQNETVSQVRCSGLLAWGTPAQHLCSLTGHQ